MIQLTEKEKDIYERRERKETFKSIAESYGVSIERIRRHYAKARRKTWRMEDFNKQKDLPVKDLNLLNLGLSRRAENAVRNFVHPCTLEGLSQCTFWEIYCIKNCGWKTLKELYELLKEYGLSFALKTDFDYNAKDVLDGISKEEIWIGLTD